MKKTITEDGFMREVYQLEDRREQFSNEGWRALFQYIDRYDEEVGQDTELDIVSFCCEYSEYDSAWEAMKQYRPEDMPTIDDAEEMDLTELGEAQEKEAREWLGYKTAVIDVDGGGVIIANF